MSKKDVKEVVNEEATVEEMKLNGKLSFREILGMCTSFIKGEIKPEEFSEWLETINVRSYIPALDKLAIIMTITSYAHFSDVETQEVLVLEMYKNIFFYLYLGGYLGVDIIPSDITYENYDLLEPLIGPWIEVYSKRDIEIFKEMLHDSLDFYGMNSVTETLNSIDYTAIQESTDANKKFLEELGKNVELTKNLKDIMDFNDPLTKKVVDEIKKINVDKTKE